MNNSFSKGDSMPGGLLTSGKPPVFAGHSPARDAIRRDQRLANSSREADNTPASRNASSAGGAGPTANREATDFRATMDKIASAKAQAKREDSERAATKKSDQQLAADKLQQRSLDQQQSAESLRNDRQASADSAPDAVSQDTETQLVNPGDKYPGDEPAVPAAESPAGQNLAGYPLHSGSESALLTATLVPADLADQASTLVGESLFPPPLGATETLMEPLPVSPLTPTTGLASAGSERTAQVTTAIGSGAGDLSLATQPATQPDLKTASLNIGSTANSLVSGEEVGNKLPLDGDSARVDSNTNFGKLLAAAQGEPESLLAPQELTASKVSATGYPVIEGSVRATETPAMRGFVVQTGVPMTLGQPRWGEAVGERVLWLAAQNLSSAELRLDPPELGPMQVRITIQQDQANISFSSPHPGVREALDQSAIRLREMFADQGLNLLNLDVSDQPLARHQSGEKSQGDTAGHRGDADAGEEESVVGITTKLNTARLIDHYA